MILAYVFLPRADVLRENTEAVFAVCDVAQEKWAMILGVRTILHPKLSLQEFLSIYSITQDFITAKERVFDHYQIPQYFHSLNCCL